MRIEIKAKDENEIVISAARNGFEIEYWGQHVR